MRMPSELPHAVVRVIEDASLLDDDSLDSENISDDDSLGPENNATTVSRLIKHPWTQQLVKNPYVIVFVSGWWLTFYQAIQP